MNMNEYQEKAMRTRPKYATDNDQIINAVMGLCGEVGEISDMLKKYFFQGHGLDYEEIAHELGDVMWYIALMCDAMQIQMSKVAEMNVDKLQKRYPKGFEAERSINR